MAVARSGSRYRWVILSLTFTAQLSNALVAQSVAPLAPIFQPELGLTKAEVGFFSSLAFAGAWGILLVAGSLTDRFGVRRMMAVGQMLTGLLVLSMSTVGSFLHAAATMFAAGVGRGTAGPGIAKAVVDWFPPTARATALGFNQTAIPIAGIATAAILPALALAVGWRSAIAAVGFVVVAGGAAAAILYRDARPGKAATARGGNPRSSLKEVVGNRKLWMVGAIGPLFAGVQFTAITYLALYFNEVVLVPFISEEAPRIVAAGGFLAVCYLGSIFARILWGLGSDRVFRGRRMVVLAMAGALSALASIAVSSLGAGYPVWLLSAVVFAYGATAMGWQGLYLAAAAETAGPRCAATGTGLCMTCSQLGFVGVPPLFGFVLDVTASYPAAWLFLGSLSATGSLVATLLARREGRTAPLLGTAERPT